jgi:dihydropteroate synthase
MVALVGIINLTPDSFSDGGRNFAPDLALREARAQLKAGASVLDVGAESTRPGATPLSHQEEWARLADALPALVAMAHAARAQLSLDTYHAATAQKALALGVDWINDVSFGADEAMLPLIAKSHCRYVLTHALSVPASAQQVLPASVDAAAEVVRALEEKIVELEAAGIARSRLVVDPGIGFGKTPEQSLALLKRIDTIAALGVPVMVGHSRKSFLQAAEGLRDAATLAASLYLAGKKVDYLRVHAVAEHAQALATWKQLHA